MHASTRLAWCWGLPRDEQKRKPKGSTTFNTRQKQLTFRLTLCSMAVSGIVYQKAWLRNTGIPILRNEQAPLCLIDHFCSKQEKDSAWRESKLLFNNAVHFDSLLETSHNCLLMDFTFPHPPKATSVAFVWCSKLEKLTVIIGFPMLDFTGDWIITYRALILGNQIHALFWQHACFVSCLARQTYARKHGSSKPGFTENWDTKLMLGRTEKSLPNPSPSTVENQTLGKLIPKPNLTEHTNETDLCARLLFFLQTSLVTALLFWARSMKNRLRILCRSRGNKLHDFCLCSRGTWKRECHILILLLQVGLLHLPSREHTVHKLFFACWVADTKRRTRCAAVKTPWSNFNASHHS